MNKNELKEWLDNSFSQVIENDKMAANFEDIKINLAIEPNTIDDDCFIKIADYICANKKKKFFYFVYYGKKDTLMFYDNEKRSINVRLKNNVTERFKYELILKKVRKIIDKSNSYLVFFTCANVEFAPKKDSQHILVLNESNLDQFLAKFKDF